MNRKSWLLLFVTLLLSLLAVTSAEPNYFACKCTFQGNVTITDVDDDSLCTCEVQFPHAGAAASECHCEHEDRSTFLLKSVVIGLLAVYGILGLLLILGPIINKYYPRHTDQAYLSSQGIQQEPSVWQQILDSLLALKRD